MAFTKVATEGKSWVRISKSNFLILTVMARWQSLLNIIFHVFSQAFQWVKGNLAHNFMVSYLVLISCLSDMVRTYLTEENANINIFCSYR